MSKVWTVAGLTLALAAASACGKSAEQKRAEEAARQLEEAAKQMEAAGKEAEKAAAQGAEGMAAGMEALAHTLAKEERQHGIRVNIVAPGLVDTDMGDGFLQSVGVTDKDVRAAESPFGFICKPEDVAGAIVYLCSEEGRYITGQRITVNGGGW